MKKMYQLEERIYTDCGRRATVSGGRATAWVAQTIYTTYEEAKALSRFVRRDTHTTGDWRIVARTIDEANFTVVDEVVESYSWWDNVGCKENAKDWVRLYTECLADAEAIDVKTEAGLKRKAKKIAEIKAKLEKYNKILAE